MRAEDAELYEKYADDLIRFAGVLVGPSGAEDLLVTTALAVFASPRWPDITNKRAYLYRALVNHAAKERRATHRRLAREARLAAQFVPSHEPAALDLDVLTALRRLTVRQRAIVYLRYWRDLTNGDIGRAVDLPLRTVGCDLAAAQRRLKEHLS